MRIAKIKIKNFKCFEGSFSLDLDGDVNIIVGNNEAGKTTILEAIHLGLTGMLNGKYLRNDLSSYLFNKSVAESYISSLDTDSPQIPPHVLIELFFLGNEYSDPILQGNGNSENLDSCGISFCIEFDEQYQAEYGELCKADKIKTIPIEYYKITWRSFSREAISIRNIPIKSAMIDSTSMRTHNGSDMYISRIIRDNLEDKEKVEISQEHRQMKEAFMQAESIKVINQKIKNDANVSVKEVSISVDLSTQNAWETSLMTYIDGIPFHYIGKGEQCIVKTNLALSHKKSHEANIILLEEPENHLSYVRLNELIESITKGIGNKQIIISTHSSFVANKLGLDNLILLNDYRSTRLNQLSAETKKFFKKLPGYNTLRLILCTKAILVEGDSDELVVQKAYMIKNSNKLPIHDGIDVISIGTSFIRFLEIAEKINKPVSVVTDNDGNVDALEKKYRTYLGENTKKNIRICYDSEIDSESMSDFNYNTLEPKLLKANGLEGLNRILNTKCNSSDDLLKHMKRNKTDCALKIFETREPIEIPQYILDAVSDE